MILEQINPDLLELAKESDTVLKDIYKEIDAVCLTNSNRILSAFIENRVSYSDFSDINGYGNYDEGRNKLEKIFATVLGEWNKCNLFNAFCFIKTWRYDDFINWSSI